MTKGYTFFTSAPAEGELVIHFDANIVHTQLLGEAVVVKVSEWRSIHRQAFGLSGYSEDLDAPQRWQIY